MWQRLSTFIGWIVKNAASLVSIPTQYLCSPCLLSDSFYSSWFRPPWLISVHLRSLGWRFIESQSCVYFLRSSFSFVKCVVFSVFWVRLFCYWYCLRNKLNYHCWWVVHTVPLWWVPHCTVSPQAWAWPFPETSDDAKFWFHLVS